MKETSSKIARLAGRVLQGHKPTRKEIESLAASALAQCEAEQESVRAWGTEIDGKPLPWATKLREDADYSIDRDTKGTRERVIRVEIRRVRRLDTSAKAMKRGRG